MLGLGDIVRYGSGSTALARLTSTTPHGWYATQCMGGSTFIANNRQLLEPDDDDMRMWKKCAWHRGEALRPVLRPRLVKCNGEWIAKGISTYDFIHLCEKERTMYIQAFNQAQTWAIEKNFDSLPVEI